MTESKQSAGSFDELGLLPSLLTTVKKQGYTTPSPIQAQAIPPVLARKDVMAAAQTGTGKTAGFALPILDILSQGPPARARQVRALILTPTRELAAQVAESVRTYGESLQLRSAVVFGGVSINPQIRKLKGGVDILVATPGRLLDLQNQRAVQLNELEIFVLDEADRMLDMGFIHDIRKIIKILPKRRQNLFFSATFSDDIRRLARTIVNDPVEISVSPKNQTARTVTHSLYEVDKNDKSKLLTELVHENNWKQVLVFVRTKHGANRLSKYLVGKKISSAAIHGNKSQGARTRALDEFKSGHVRVLVATDIAARGIDISQLPHVINFDLPNVPEDYVHRIGRTGRAGTKGEAISLVCADEFEHLVSIQNLIKEIIPRHQLDGFSPSHKVPEAKIGQRVPKAKKKAKSGGGGQKRRIKPEHRDGQKSGEMARGNKPRASSKRRTGARKNASRRQSREHS
ncbi:DEAD/DEAH box helicase [Persicirhabdus sediminis]|uniref:DEAD-box ATP-dependent RNA helicase RhpA n=1 Tax=Persicirhabdus sediminis TaxID=454144 RepID=A0A8J7SLW3_9BACT|nr:DEAD/DEAH box helicase [Persicirhabdus sediminis]MBK1792596.1 DEAD/DEAH box helicase [Persicirhabdus sediminis]